MSAFCAFCTLPKLCDAGSVAMKYERGRGTLKRNPHDLLHVVYDHFCAFAVVDILIRHDRVVAVELQLRGGGRLHLPFQSIVQRGGGLILLPTALSWLHIF